MPNSRQSRSQSTRRFDQVVCRETAKDFSDESADKEASKQLCMMHCPVKDACLEYALANESKGFRPGSWTRCWLITLRLAA